MNRKWSLAVVAVIMGIYISAIAIGMHVRNFFWLQYPQPRQWTVWQAPRLLNVPATPHGDSIRYGALLFNQTQLYASTHAGARMACTSCHAEGGIQPFASPMVGLPALFPMFNKRAGHRISLQDRIQECFVRSENGTPLSYTSKEMQALTDYITWLSQPQPNHAPFKGRGLVDLPDLKPDPQHGAAIYTAQCAGCHGVNGEGASPLFPPLWGPGSYNDGAGMDNVTKMAAFVQHNMPQNRMGILTPQEAYDVSAYVHAQPRPRFNEAYKHY